MQATHLPAVLLNHWPQSRSIELRTSSIAGIQSRTATCSLAIQLQTMFGTYQPNLFEVYSFTCSKDTI